VHGAELFHGLARPQIVDADVKYDALEALEGVPQHQRFQSPIVLSAPVISGDERVADCHHALGFVQIVEAGAADQRSGRVVDHSQGAARLDGALEVSGKHVALVAILVRMLLPDEGIRRDGMEGLEVAGLERFEFDPAIGDPRL
jgi:hypothetical protein